MGNSEIDILKRAIQREKIARKQAEKILEDKSRELYLLTQELKVTNKKLEDQVGKKESELQGVFDNLVDAYVLMDITGNVLEMNHSAIGLFGYNIANEKLNVLELIYKDDYQYAMNSFYTMVTQGSFSDYQARVYTKNNGIRTVHINASLIKDKNDKPIGAHGIVRDITERLEQKQIFEEQKKQLSVIVENSSLGIVLTQFGKILQTNKAFQKLTGYTKDELLQLEVKNISIKEEYAVAAPKLDQMNDGSIDNISLNKRYVKKNKSSVWAKTNIAAVRDEKGKTKYQVALVEDITEQLKTEKQRDRLFSKLEKSNQELKDYAHIVSHDLKSPLRSMNALVTWLKEDYADKLDDDAHNSLDMLLKKLDKMDQLIIGILAYSSIDKQDYKDKKIDLKELLKDLIDVIHIPSHIKVTVQNKLPIVKGDKFRLQQLFQNLISNAIKYNDKENGYVKVSCIEKEHFWQFEISDNGLGIPEKYHEKIFQVFQTLDSNKESTGVGLSIVKKIVEMYKGKIWIKSEVGTGTTFCFTLKK